jgi:hypothetical protein
MNGLILVAWASHLTRTRAGVASAGESPDGATGEDGDMVRAAASASGFFAVDPGQPAHRRIRAEGPKAGMAFQAERNWRPKGAPTAIVIHR